MIVELIMNALYSVFAFLTIPIHIPELPPEIQTYLDTAFDYLSAGAGIVANYTPLAYIFILFAVILLVDVGINIYHFVMWVIRKIPMLGMS